MGIQATGNAINVGIGDYFRIANGTAVGQWGAMDSGAMIRQLTGD